jgi:hypothetical protein
MLVKKLFSNLLHHKPYLPGNPGGPVLPGLRAQALVHLRLLRFGTCFSHYLSSKILITNYEKINDNLFSFDLYNYFGTTNLLQVLKKPRVYKLQHILSVPPSITMRKLKFNTIKYKKNLILQMQDILLSLFFLIKTGNLIP